MVKKRNNSLKISYFKIVNNFVKHNEKITNFVIVDSAIFHNYQRKKFNWEIVGRIGA